MAYFPMFLDINGADCLIVGGGQVALRKVKVLKDFGARLFVVAPVICNDIRLMSQELKDVFVFERQAVDEDFCNKILVVAATDDKEINHRISRKAKELNIPVNAVDQTEDCTFIFPSYHREKNVVAAYSSGGNSPVITQYLRDEGKKTLTDFVGDMAEFMGELRPYIKEHTDSESVRKNIYREIFELGMKNKRLPDKIQIEEILEKWKE